MRSTQTACYDIGESSIIIMTPMLQKPEWEVQIRAPQPVIDRKAKAEPLESMLGAEARAQRVRKLRATQRPFALGTDVKAWLDEASTPLEPLGDPSRSPGQLLVGYGTRRITAGDKLFDQTAEQQTRQYLASLTDTPSTLERPFAADGFAKSWLEEASSPMEGIDTDKSRVSSLSELPVGFTTSPEDLADGQSFDQTAEEQTQQYLAGLSNLGTASSKPFASGSTTPGWLESASHPLVSLAA